jgi:tetratricopeptide (TPR) repeat protein
MFEERELDNFIGRTHELAFFQTWLEEEDPHTSSMLFFYEGPEGILPKGGIGKTWILQKCREIVRKRKECAVVVVDFFSIQDRDGVELARSIVAGINRLETGWSSAEFDTLYERYRQAVQRRDRNEYLIDLRRQMHYTLQAALEDLQKRLPDARKRLLVFGDTYERIEQHPEALSLLPTHHFLETYHIPAIGFVLAGRNEPDRQSNYWRSYSQRVHGLSVSAFTVDDVISYVDEHIATPRVRKITAEQARRIHEQTQGRPILVGLVTDILNQRVSLAELLGVEEPRFAQYLLWKIFSLSDSSTLAVRCMAHLHHRFDRRMLEWLFRECQMARKESFAETIEETWQTLNRFSFVRQSATTDEIALHDEMRRMVIDTVWASEQGGIPTRRELSEHAIHYYELLITTEPYEPLLQVYRIEKLYHQLYLDPQKNFDLLKQQLETALRLKQNDVVHVLFQETRELLPLFSEEQRYSLEEYSAWLLQNEEKFAEALHLYHGLLALTETQWAREKQADLLLEQGICYTRLSQFPKAIFSLNRAAEIYQEQQNSIQVGIVFGRIGYMYMLQGALDTAVRYYKTSIEIARKEKRERLYADILNSLGRALLLQGKQIEALGNCRASLRIREELNAQGNLSDVVVGYSLTAVGNVYYEMGQKAEAEKYFQRAYSLYEKNFYQAGIATLSNRFGMLALDRGDRHMALEWFQKAYQRGIDYNEEAMAESQYRQSLLLCMSGQSEEALALLARAIEWAREMKYYHHQAMWQIEQIEMLLQMERLEEMLTILDATEDISTHYQYYFLLGKIAEMRGNIAYSAKDYSAAFQFYTRYCYFMALYNRAEYNKAAENMIMKHLLDLPNRDLLRQMWEQLNDDWSALDLEEEPILVKHLLKEVRELLDF